MTSFFKYCSKISNTFKKSNNGKKHTDEFLIDYILKTFYKKKRTNSPFKSKYFIDYKPSAEFARENGVLPYNINNAIHRGLKNKPKKAKKLVLNI